MAADEGPSASVRDVGKRAADGALDAAGVDDGGARLELVRVEADPVNGRLRREGDEDDVRVADVDRIALVKAHNLISGALRGLVEGAADEPHACYRELHSSSPRRRRGR